MDAKHVLSPGADIISPLVAVAPPEQPDENAPEPPGGRAAERLRDFLAKRLPPGASVEELNAEIAKQQKKNEEQSERTKE